MTDVSDLVDLVVCTPLGTSDHCFVSFMLCVEQSLPEFNVRRTVFLKHCTNWDCVHGGTVVNDLYTEHHFEVS